MKCQSPVKKFPGYVVLPDFLNVFQVRAFEDAYFGDPNEAAREGEKVYISVSDEKMLPIFVELIKEWHIDGIPENPTVQEVPMTPAKAGHELVAWLSGELFKLYVGETEVPNA